MTPGRAQSTVNKCLSAVVPELGEHYAAGGGQRGWCREGARTVNGKLKTVVVVEVRPD